MRWKLLFVYFSLGLERVSYVELNRRNCIRFDRIYERLTIEQKRRVLYRFLWFTSKYTNTVLPLQFIIEINVLFLSYQYKKIYIFLYIGAWTYLSYKVSLKALRSLCFVYWRIILISISKWTVWHKNNIYLIRYRGCILIWNWR